MTNKQKRIQKVIVHREKELDQRVVELGKARVEAERVESAALAEQKKLELATAERDKMADRTMSAREWRDANEWMASRELSHLAVTRELEKVTAQVEAQKGHVLVARRALKGVEMVEERLKTAELRAEERADQRLQDELARSSQKRAKGKP
ncbi:MAG TPA: flagellar FliJ family protein [Polyangiaceae bacterium]|jgi:flagellar export protein FliJ|nr:flagellar FliJ family protein [Polyangiaceae bacterium]